MVTRRTSSARATLATLALVLLSLAAPAAPASASDASPADAGPLGTSSGASVVAADASAPPPPPAPASALRRATGPGGGAGSARYGGTRFTADDEAHFSDRLVAMLRKPCEAYARNVNDEPALHLQHAAVIFLRHKCARAPEPIPGQTANACSDLANAVSIDLTHQEATAMLKQLLHERCQNEAILMTNPDTQSRDAAAFLVKDTVRRVAEEEQEIRDYAGIPTDREEIARRPPVGEDGMLLLGPSDDEDDDASAPGSVDAGSGFCAADGTGAEGCAARGGDPGTFGGARRPDSWGWDGPDEEDRAGVPGDDAEVEETSRVERMVLTDLYRVTEGSRWWRQDGWLSRRPHCSWEGVTCLDPNDAAGVLSVSLPENGLAGTLPQTLARLHRLRHLDLSRNELRGTLSSAFGSLSRLKSLSLRSNAVRGKIPRDLGAAASLLQLDLSDNNFAGALPSELGRLRRLRMLNVSSNGLTGHLPAAVCGLPDLEVLSVAKNRMSGGLATAAAALAAGGESSSLRLFDASDNAFDGAPPPVPHLAPSLFIWDVSRNSFRGRLPEDPTPANLRVLAVSGMRDVTGPIPPTLLRSRTLRHVDLSGCGLNGALPDALMSLPNARLVNVSDNQLTGTIPSEGEVDPRRMKSLREFDASGNRLTGTLPPALAGLGTLRVLDLSRNLLEGTLPGQQMGNLAHLRRLDLRQNAFEGTLPSELGTLSRLEHLDLSENRLRGPVPVSLLTGANLRHLDVSGNELDWTSLGSKPIQEAPRSEAPVERPTEVNVARRADH